MEESTDVEPCKWPFEWGSCCTDETTSMNTRMSVSSATQEGVVDLSCTAIMA